VSNADPVLVRRRQMARLAALGKRIGYGCLLLSVVAFFVGLVAGYGVAGPVVIGAWVVCTFTLAPAIVLGYAVRAAEREDRELGRPTE
jgi:uncharacterized membrane protein